MSADAARLYVLNTPAGSASRGLPVAAQAPAGVVDFICGLSVADSRAAPEADTLKGPLRIPILAFDVPLPSLPASD